MKYLNYLLIILFSTVLLTSCSEDDEPITPTKIEIENLEYGNGHGNSRVISAGGNLHMGAKIVADATIYSITIDIHKEENTSSNWSFKKEYKGSKYTLVKNIDFHEHIDISADAKPGEYHFHLEVKDNLGNIKSEEGELIITPKEQSTTITIENFEFGKGHGNSRNIKQGGDLHVAAKVTSEIAIAEVKVSIIKQGTTSDWSLEDINIDVHQPDNVHEYHKHFDIPYTAVAGNYNFVFLVTDINGGIKTVEGVLEVKPYTFKLTNVKFGTFEQDDKKVVADKLLKIKASVGASESIDKVKIIIKNIYTGFQPVDSVEYSYTDQNTNEIDFSGEILIEKSKYTIGNGGAYLLTIEVYNKKGEHKIFNRQAFPITEN